MPNSLANVEKLAIDGNDLDQAGIDPLVEALNTSALPRLRTVFGVGGAAHGTEVTSLRQVKRMRDKLSSIDFSKSDATQHLGEVQRGIYGQALQDINRIEARLQQAQAHRHDRSCCGNRADYGHQDPLVPFLVLGVAHDGN
jgi:hypothetical protein